MKGLTVETTIREWVVQNVEGGRIQVGQSWARRIRRRDLDGKAGKSSGT